MPRQLRIDFPGAMHRRWWITNAPIYGLTPNSKLSMSQLENTLKQLRLSGLLQTLDVRLQEATAILPAGCRRWLEMQMDRTGTVA